MSPLLPLDKVLLSASVGLGRYICVTQQAEIVIITAYYSCVDDQIQQPDTLGQCKDIMSVHCENLLLFCTSVI